jgi:peptidoglycan/LPS O-acetylase OafA/YrhL
VRELFQQGATKPAMSYRAYFPGLNALRFYAAFGVLIVHIEQTKEILQVRTDGNWLRLLLLLFPSGQDSVTLFFVLSGFLITYLLLKEDGDTGTIHIRHFYVRRALRIMPLYYLTLAVGCLLLPIFFPHDPILRSFVSPNFTPNLLFCLILLPNIPFALDGLSLPLAHLWTIGVEQQFYLAWPALVKRLRGHMLALLLGVIVVKVCLNVIVDGLQTAATPDVFQIVLPIARILGYLRFESMAIGAIGAYLVFNNREKVLSWLYSLPVRLLLIFGIVVIAVDVRDSVPVEWNLFVSVTYMILILNVSCNPKPFLRVENKVAHFLGEISYGVYMLHPAIIYALLLFARNTGFSDSPPMVFNTVLYALIVGLTLGGAATSYLYFEKPFLSMRHKFTSRPATSKLEQAQPIPR